jgi:hypothetical protein
MADSCSSKALLALAAAVALSGCAAGGGPQLPTLSLPSAPSVEAASQQQATTPPPSAPGAAQQTGTVIDQTGGQGGSATDIYSRVASGAMKCWFAVGGPLKSDFVYHATAAPASRGGKAQIVIHRRDPTQPNPRGAKAYLVDIDPTGEASATVKIENLKMTEAFASAMTSDITRWTKGEEGCSQSSAVAGWTPAAPQPIAEAAPPSKSKFTKKSKAKPKAKATSAQAKTPTNPPLKASAEN